MHIRQYARFHDAEEYAKEYAYAKEYEYVRNMQINLWKNHNKQMVYAKYA